MRDYRPRRYSPRDLKKEKKKKRKKEQVNTLVMSRSNVPSVPPFLFFSFFAHYGLQSPISESGIIVAFKLASFHRIISHKLRKKFAQEQNAVNIMKYKILNATKISLSNRDFSSTINKTYLRRNLNVIQTENKH